MKNPVNFRDLGGLSSSFGKKIKPCRLLRSGELYQLSEDEKRTLLHNYKLKVLVDFRTKFETESHPDDSLEGVSYHHVDILSAAADHVINLANAHTIRDKNHADEFLMLAYELAMTNEVAQQGYREFLEYLLQNKEGAVLFHCFAGKDRTGIAAAIILTILGVSKDDIFSDYMKTNEMRAKKNAEIIAEEKQAGRSDNELAIIEATLFVKKQYLQHAFDIAAKHYGSFENYIKQALQITEEEINELRNNYLE